MTTANDELSAFQRDSLRAVAMLDEPHGLAVKQWLADHCEYGEVHHGRLYPNMDTLVDRGLVDKRSMDGRTNKYVLTTLGLREVTRIASGWKEAHQAVEDV